MTHPSSPLRTQFGIRFSVLARHWRRAIESSLAAAGLSDATWLPLVHLSQGGDGITQKDLAARIGLEGSSLVRLLDILARKGLVERQIDPLDGRARRIFLTGPGRLRVAEILAELARAEAVLLADIPDSALSAMLEHFARIDARLTQVQAQEGPGEQA